jgi:hypothetical protein
MLYHLSYASTSGNRAYRHEYTPDPFQMSGTIN